MAPRILIVAGSMRKNSRTRVLCQLAERGVVEAGGQAQLLDLRELALPVFEKDNNDQADLEAVKAARESAEWAHGFILGTPEYHGGISGSLKNWLDFLYRELAGKLVGVITQAGGDHGGDLSAMATLRSANWCRAFTLPYTAAARRPDWRGLTLISDRVAERVRRMAFDVVRYALLLNDEFERAKELGNVDEAGFAGWQVD